MNNFSAFHFASELHLCISQPGNLRKQTQPAARLGRMYRAATAASSASWNISPVIHLNSSAPQCNWFSLTRKKRKSKFNWAGFLLFYMNSSNKAEKSVETKESPSESSLLIFEVIKDKANVSDIEKRLVHVSLRNNFVCNSLFRRCVVWSLNTLMSDSRISSECFFNSTLLLLLLKSYEKLRWFLCGIFPTGRRPGGITFFHGAQCLHKEFVSVNLCWHAATQFHKTGLTDGTQDKKKKAHTVKRHAVRY